MNALYLIELAVIGSLIIAQKASSIHWRFFGQHQHPVSQRNRLKGKTLQIWVIPPPHLGIPRYMEFVRIRMNDYNEEEHPMLSTVKDTFFLFIGIIMLASAPLSLLHVL